MPHYQPQVRPLGSFRAVKPEAKGGRYRKISIKPSIPPRLQQCSIHFVLLQQDYQPFEDFQPHATSPKQPQSWVSKRPFSQRAMAPFPTRATRSQSNTLAGSRTSPSLTRRATSKHSSTGARYAIANHRLYQIRFLRWPRRFRHGYWHWESHQRYILRCC